MFPFREIQLCGRLHHLTRFTFGFAMQVWRAFDPMPDGRLWGLFSRLQLPGDSAPGGAGGQRCHYIEERTVCVAQFRSLAPACNCSRDM